MAARRGPIPKHQNKEIEAALELFREAGWDARVPGNHAWGVLYCPFADKCLISVSSTPRNPVSHAKDLKRDLNKCTMESPTPDESEGGDSDITVPS